MSDFLKGNFDVKHKVNVEEIKDDAESFRIDGPIAPV